MAIDTSIYGMIQRPQVKSPMDMQAEAYTLRNLGQESQLRSQQIATAQALEQQRREKIQREQNFRQRLGQGASDQQLYEADPEAAGNFFETQAKIGKEAAQANSAKVDAEGKRITNEQNEYKMQREKLSDLYNRLSQVKDENTYYNAINQGFDDGVLDMQLANELVDHPFNLEEIQGLSQKMLTDMQRLEIKGKLHDLTQKQKEDPLKLKKLENEVATGTPDPVTNLTPEQTAQDKRARAMLDLDKEQFGETKRHNRNTERMAEQRIALDKIEKAAVAKGMNQESAKVYAIAETIVPELEQLRDEIQKNPKLAIGGIISGLDPTLVRLAENAADKVGRLRSGGAVNPNEEKRFMGQIARQIDVFTGDPGPAIAAINGLIIEAQTVKSKMNPGGNATGAPQAQQFGSTQVQQWGRDANGKIVKK